MTAKQLEKIGLIPSRGLSKRYFILPDSYIEIKIDSKASYSDVLKLIFSKGKEMGEEQGMERKISEIKKVLNIQEIDL